jgi:hypothetical protein
MIVDPIHIVWAFIGIVLCPNLTLGLILIMLGHPFLGVFALIWGWCTGGGRL